MTTGLCFSLDGYDVVATMATGTGKTGFFILLLCTGYGIGLDLKYAASYRGLIYSATNILPYSSCIYIYLAD